MGNLKLFVALVSLILVSACTKSQPALIIQQQRQRIIVPAVSRFERNMKESGYLQGAQVVQEYYVSPYGNDGNAGTINAPFQTLTKIASLSLVPGTRIWLQGGETFEGPLTITSSGTITKPIEVCSYGPLKATIDGQDDEAIKIENKDYLLIHDLKLAGNGRTTGNTKNGLHLINSSFSTVQDIVATGFQKAGIFLDGCKYSNLYYSYCYLNGFAGIDVEGLYADNNGNLIPVGSRTSYDIKVQNCVAENNPGDPTRNNNHSGNGIIVGSVNNCLIEYCSATNNGYDMPRPGNGPVGIWGYQCDNLTIRKCISYKNKTSPTGQDGGGFDFDGGVTNSLMEYNLSYDNEGAGYGIFQYWGAGLFNNNIIRFCVSINDAQKSGGPLYIWRDDNSAAVQNVTVHNCLFYSTTKRAFYSLQDFAPVQNINMHNNVFVGVGNILEGAMTGLSFTNNIYYNPNSTVNLGNATGYQGNPMIAGPMISTLTDPHLLTTQLQFKPAAGSPMLTNGQNVTGNDYYGQSFTNVPFVGISKN